MNVSAASPSAMKSIYKGTPLMQARQGTVDRFVKLAVRGLVPMFDQQRQLFCYRLKKTDNGMIPEGISYRYTMMTLMGLHRLTETGARVPFDTPRILDSLLADISWIDNLGDLGVALWMCGISCPERLASLEPRLGLQTALTRFRGARQAVTMELAWFLTGLSYWAQSDPGKGLELEPLARQTFDLLRENQGERGFFGHLSTLRSLSGMTRGRIGSFADQVYPFYAMAQFAKAYHHDEAMTGALKCAVGICAEQGPAGQWWWHYDSVGGRVADGYPVFSVHQHAMAPMTLFGLAEIANRNFDESIYKGLAWINSNNELNIDMESSSDDVIWRCIFRSQRSLTRYLKAGFGRYSETIEHQRPEDLKVLYECRPYELGWLLYAFASRAGRDVVSENDFQTPEAISQTETVAKN